MLLLLTSTAHAQNLVNTHTPGIRWQPAPGQVTPQKSPGGVPLNNGMAPRSSATGFSVQVAQAGQENGPTTTFPHHRNGTRQVAGGQEDDEVGFDLQTDYPGVQRLFRRDSEGQLIERLKQEASQTRGAGKIFFPKEQPLTSKPFQPRSFPYMTKLVEPCYVMHNRLYFEQRNFERHGWEIGPIQPAFCLAGFYYDLAMLPYNMWTRPLDRTETSAGKCLPGDMVPLMVYPEEFSVTGMLGLAGVYVAGPFIFP